MKAAAAFRQMSIKRSEILCRFQRSPNIWVTNVPKKVLGKNSFQTKVTVISLFFKYISATFFGAFGRRDM
jgi:hypothetical protein